nr:MAG TPA: hypothetical protein [Siphoviridae sp. ctqA315]
MQKFLGKKLFSSYREIDRVSENVVFLFICLNWLLIAG